MMRGMARICSNVMVTQRSWKSGATSSSLVGDEQRGHLGADARVQQGLPFVVADGAEQLGVGGSHEPTDTTAVVTASNMRSAAATSG